MSRPLLILASASPRRVELLRLAGYAPRVLASRVPESRHRGETPQAMVQRLALAKATEVGGQAPGFGKVNPGSVTVDHVEITPLKVLESSVEYQLTPFVSVNSNFSVADKNLTVVLQKREAAALGLPIHQATNLFSTAEKPELLGLLSQAWVATGFSQPRERTVVKSNKALMVKNGRFASVIIKAGLVAGPEGSQYHTFRRLGENYVSSSGHSFPVAEGMRYGRPEYLLISAGHKQFFETESKVKVNSSFDEVLKLVDTQVFTRASKIASSAEAENSKLKAQMSQLSSRFQQVRSSAERDLVKANRQVSALAEELAAVRSSLTQARLAQRAGAASPVPVKSSATGDKPFALNSEMFKKLAGKVVETK